MMNKELDDTWFGLGNNLTWLTSSALEDLGDEHNATFAPPNSPMGPSPYLRISVPIPTSSRSVRLQDCDNASPVVSGAFDNTWLPFSEPPLTPDPFGSYSRNAPAFPYCSIGHDRTFRDPASLAASSSNNQILSENNLELLHNSLLLDSTRKKKRSRHYEDLAPGDDSPTKHNNNNSPFLEPMFQMFLKTKPGDSHQSHILSCIKGLLDSKIISPEDVCVESFLRKSGELLAQSSKCEEDAVFHLLTLFEKYLLPSIDSNSEKFRLLSKYCRGPIGKLAMAGNEELSTRADNCLEML